MSDKSGRLTKLELEALCAALSHYSIPEVVDFFRIIPLLRVEHRRRTGFGFFTKFVHNERIRKVEAGATPPSNDPPCAVGFHPELEGFVDFTLWIKNGELECLEASSTVSWPEDESEFVVTPWPKAISGFDGRFGTNR